MNLQTRYDLEVAEDRIAEKVARDVRPLEAIDVRKD
jgi:plasmid maintenance system antidote protein VapI